VWRTRAHQQHPGRRAHHGRALQWLRDAERAGTYSADGHRCHHHLRRMARRHAAPAPTLKRRRPADETYTAWREARQTSTREDRMPRALIAAVTLVGVALAGASATAEAQEKHTIGVSYQNLAFPYVAALQKAAQNACKALGVQCVETDAVNDTEKEL